MHIYTTRNLLKYKGFIIDYEEIFDVELVTDSQYILKTSTKSLSFLIRGCWAWNHHPRTWLVCWVVARLDILDKLLRTAVHECTALFCGRLTQVFGNQPYMTDPIYLYLQEILDVNKNEENIFQIFLNYIYIFF